MKPSTRSEIVGQSANTRHPRVLHQKSLVHLHLSEKPYIHSLKKSNEYFVSLFQIVTRLWTEIRSLLITCSIEITWLIDKLHLPQAECEYSLTSPSFKWVETLTSFTDRMLLFFFLDPFTKIDGDEQGCLVQNSRMTRVSSLSHNFLLITSPVNGVDFYILPSGIRLLQVGIKSSIGLSH